MSPAELSSIKWEQDGEMSAQDTWNLVKRLTKVEEQDKASSSEPVHLCTPNDKQRVILKFIDAAKN